MAKEFKDFDKEFAMFKRTLMFWEEKIQQPWPELAAFSHQFDSWKMPVESWTQEQVKTAVYECADSLEWQKFRVSLKGFSTREKLVRLAYYRQYKGLYNQVKCRVDNYIGALVRGGCLKPDTYEIIK